MAEKECPLARIGVIIAYYLARKLTPRVLKRCIEVDALCHKEDCGVWNILYEECGLRNKYD